MKAHNLLRLMKALRIVREVLAWTAVVLAIPMAGFSIVQSWNSDRWEREDQRWEKEDVERHAKIMGMLRQCIAKER